VAKINIAKQRVSNAANTESIALMHD